MPICVVKCMVSSCNSEALQSVVTVTIPVQDELRLVAMVRQDWLRLQLQALRDMVAQCLNKDPEARPTAADLLKHKFFKVRLAINAHLQSKTAFVYYACKALFDSNR